MLNPLLKHLWTRENTVMLFQNEDDRNFFIKRKLCKQASPIIRGSGVDINRFIPNRRKITGKAIIIGCATRLIKDKGLEELISAVSSFGLQSRFELHIAGSIYPDNPSSFSQKEVEAWAKIEAIRLKGYVSDMVEFWHTCDIAILPSHREGLPKSLIEAAACGLPLLGADARHKRNHNT